MDFTTKYLNPLTDFGFKKLFGEEPNKDILIHFLNSILPQEHQIEDLEYKKLEEQGNLKERRAVMFDLQCVSITGEIFIVEMQKTANKWFKDRAIYYSSFPIQRQVDKGMGTKYIQLSAVYMIGVMDFTFEDEHEKDEIVLHNRLMNVKTLKQHSDKLNYLYLQLPNFKKTLEELKTNSDKWMYLLKHLSKLDKKPEALKEKVFDRFFEVAQISSYSEQELDEYLADLKEVMDGEAVLLTAEEKGREEGREEGIEIGQKKKALETAQNLLKMGLSAQQIANATGLAPAHVARLKQEED